METIHGAELMLLSFPGHDEETVLGGLLTIATPMGKNWHWLPLDPTLSSSTRKKFDIVDRPHPQTSEGF